MINNLKTISIAVIAMLFFSAKQAKAQLPSSDPAYKLVWADSFNTTVGYRIDPAKWNMKFNWNQKDSLYCDWQTDMDGGVDSGYCINKDIAYQKWYKGNPPAIPNIPAVYPPDTTNCQVTGGYLNLYTRKDTGYFSGHCWNWPSCPATPNPCNVSPYTCSGSPSTCWNVQNKQFKYTSAFIISKYQFRYGYFEIKFKVPALPTPPQKTVTGTSFWMYNAGDDLVAGDASTKIPWSEIDIFEIIGHNNMFTTNLHYTPHGHDCNYACYSQVDTVGVISSSTFHTAGCLWTSHEIITYLDGVPVSTLTNTHIRPDSMLPMTLIVAVNATPDSHDSLKNTNAVFPCQFQVDYVKVWQIDTTYCDTAKTYCSSALNPSTYQSKLYQSVNIDGSTCTHTNISSTNFLSIYGTNSVTLNAGFSIDGNSTVLINTMDCPTKPFRYIGTPAPQPAPIQFLKKQSGHYTQ